MRNDVRIRYICKIIQWVTLAIGVLSIIISILCWSSIPETIPSHYNALGVADQYSNKGILILLLSMVAILMGIMSIATYCVRQEMVSKHAKEDGKSQANDIYVMLIFMNFAIQSMLAYIIFCSASGRALGRMFLPIMLLIVFGPIVVYVMHRTVTGRKNLSGTILLKQMEVQEEGIAYRSKVDWWLGLLLGGAMVGTLYMALAPLFQGKGIQWSMVVTAAVTMMIVLPLFGIKYVFYSGHLTICCGMYGKERVEYGTIRQVKETRNPISSAAMSLDRLQIDYLVRGVHKTVLISPVRKKEFMNRLEQCRENGENPFEKGI